MEGGHAASRDLDETDVPYRAFLLIDSTCMASSCREANSPHDETEMPQLATLVMSPSPLGDYPALVEAVRHIMAANPPSSGFYDAEFKHGLDMILDALNGCAGTSSAPRRTRGRSCVLCRSLKPCRGCGRTFSDVASNRRGDDRAPAIGTSLEPILGNVSDDNGSKNRCLPKAARTPVPRAPRISNAPVGQRSGRRLMRGKRVCAQPVARLVVGETNRCSLISAPDAWTAVPRRF